MDGWINLDKPLGITSATAVAKVKWLLLSNGYGTEIPPQKEGGKTKRKIKIGHAGTLDPLASGILPLALGKATKKVEYMMNCEKTYAFTVTWGQERTTDDAAGEVKHQSDNRPTLQEITNILPQFIGEISQIPPNFSAIKLDGKRAYDMARNGEVVEIKPRIVSVKSLTLSPDLIGGLGQQAIANNGLALDPRSEAGSSTFFCHCGKGTYIRSLARDMGRILGCYGYVSALRRTKVGKFSENNAISLEMFENMVHKSTLDFLQPVDFVLDDILA